MTKVDAIEQVMKANGGTANLNLIYENIEKYYPPAKQSKDWDAGIRGVLYRELKKGNRFKRIGLSLYALTEYTEQPRPTNDVKMHSYIEGLCVELGNFKKYKTYTADPSATYRDNMCVGSFTSLKEIPQFSYNNILTEAKRIDVIWFNDSKLLFPKMAFEIVDSIGTLNGAFNRSLQLQHFNTQFFIVAPEEHRKKFVQTSNLEIYNPTKDRFKFISYTDIISMYDNAFTLNKLETKYFDS